MKKLIGFLLVALMSGAVHAQYNTKVYMQQGGAKQVVLSGGEIEVRTGGLVDIQSGATMTNAATVTNSGVQTFTGNVIMGAVGYKSTHTASNGNWAITGGITSLGALAGTTLNTGQGAYELYKMDQNVDTAAEPTFAGATLTYGLASATAAVSGNAEIGGNLDLTGNLVASGSYAETPNTSYDAVEVSTSFSPVGSAFMVINGTGAVVLDSTPHIATTTAISGQVLTIMGGANSVTFGDEGSVTGSLLELGDTSRALGAGDILRVRYYDGKWYEESFVNN